MSISKIKIDNTEHDIIAVDLIDDCELITVEDIDTICDTDYQFVSANEVIF